LYYINFEGLDTSEVTSFRALFENCWRLQTLDLRPLDVSHVTDMSFMCDNCLFLTDIDVSTWTGKIFSKVPMQGGG
jgi:surface protein